LEGAEKKSYLPQFYKVECLSMLNLVLKNLSADEIEQTKTKSAPLGYRGNRKPESN